MFNGLKAMIAIARQSAKDKSHFVSPLRLATFQKAEFIFWETKEMCE